MPGKERTRRWFSLNNSSIRRNYGSSLVVVVVVDGSWKVGFRILDSAGDFITPDEKRREMHGMRAGANWKGKVFNLSLLLRAVRVSRLLPWRSLLDVFGPYLAGFPFSSTQLDSTQLDSTSTSFTCRRESSELCSF